MNSDNLQEHTHKGEGSRLLSLAKMSGDRLEGRLFMEGYHCPPISTNPLDPSNLNTCTCTMQGMKVVMVHVAT